MMTTVRAFTAVCITLLWICNFSVSAANKTASAGSCAANTGQSCDACVKDFDCYYCKATKFCGKRPLIKPSSSECSGDWYSYKQCKLSGNLLLIIVPVILGVILIIALCICYCCCCRKVSRRRARKRYAKEDAKREQEREEREMRHAERVAERQIKHDEIRKKYGLFKDGDDRGDGKYSRFDVA